MKGFLRRALDNARGTEQRLKPLTGSVYASNRRWPELQSESWGEKAFNATPGPGAVPLSGQLSQPGIPQATWTSAPAPLLQASSTSAPDPLLPVRPEPREPAAVGRENNSERQPTSTPGPPHQENVIRPASHGGALQAPVALPAALSPGNVPLLASAQRKEGFLAEKTVSQAPQGISRAEKIQQSEEPRRTTSLPQQRVEPLLRSGAAMPPRAAPQLSVPKNHSPQEPEIQVHIGRIEVIATAPQTARLPSPRPNRATSLADYLAGPNGRSR